MRKLMIAAVAICASAVTQAATINWGTGYLTGPSDLTKTGKSAPGETYLKAINGSSWVVTFSVFSQDELGAKTLVAADEIQLKVSSTGTFTTGRPSESSLADAVKPTTPGAPSTTFVKANGGTKVTDKWTQLADGKPYYYTLVISGAADDGSWTATKETDYIAFETAASSSSAVTINASTKTLTAGWADMRWDVTAKSVPEPTSALLLLLGVAGLALRRKQA